MVYVVVDDFLGRKLLDEGQKEWLQDYDELVQRWLDENIGNERDWEKLYNSVMYFDNEVLSYIFYLYFRQKTLTVRSRIEYLVQLLAAKKDFVLVMFGKRGSGKTTFAYLIAQILHEKYKQKIYWLGPPAELPPFIEGSTIDFDKVPEGYTCIVDEAGAQYGARTGMKADQVDFMTKLLLLRQTGRSLIVISQSPEALDISFIRESSALIFTSQFYLRMRKQRIVVNEYLNYFMPKKQGEALYYDDQLILELKFEKPPWWKQAYSDPYRAFKSSADAYRFALTIMKDTQDTKAIKNYLGLRAYSMQENDIEYIKMIAGDMGIEHLLSLNDTELVNYMQQGMSDMPLQDLIAGKKNYQKYEFFQTPIQQDTWNAKFASDPMLELMSKRNYNFRFLREMELKLTKEKNMVFSITGTTGSGKSWAGMAIAECIVGFYKKKFKLHCFPDTESLLESLNDIQEKDAIIQDEQLKDWGLGSGRSLAELHNVIETTRKKGLSFILISPELKRGLSLHHFILKTFAINDKEGISKLIAYTPEDKPLGYITVRKPPESIIREYDERIKNPTMGRIVERKGFKAWESKAEELMKNRDFTEGCTNNSMRLMYILEKYNCTTGEADAILAKINFMQWQMKQSIKN